jgi:hypothetical protein
MTEALKEKLLEAERHMKNYMDDIESTEELREMCKYCEAYCGDQHDYKECRSKWCYKFWLAYEYLDWASGYD